MIIAWFFDLSIQYHIIFSVYIVCLVKRVCKISIHRLRLLLHYLERGEVPMKVIDLRRTLSYAAKVLTACSTLLDSGKR